RAHHVRYQREEVRPRVRHGDHGGAQAGRVLPHPPVQGTLLQGREGGQGGGGGGGGGGPRRPRGGPRAGGCGPREVLGRGPCWKRRRSRSTSGARPRRPAWSWT